MRQHKNFETTNVCEFIRAIMQAADTKAQKKGITEEAQAYYVGAYNTAHAIFQAMISTETPSVITLDYKKGIEAYKEMIERDKELDQKKYHQISFDELFPKFMQTLDRVNKYLDEKETKQN